MQRSVWFALTYNSHGEEVKRLDDPHQYGLIENSMFLWSEGRCNSDPKVPRCHISLFGFPFLRFLIILIVTNQLYLQNHPIFILGSSSSLSHIETDLCITTWLFWPLVLTQMDWRHPISQFTHCTALHGIVWGSISLHSLIWNVNCGKTHKAENKELNCKAV